MTKKSKLLPNNAAAKTESLKPKPAKIAAKSTAAAPAKSAAAVKAKSPAPTKPAVATPAKAATKPAVAVATKPAKEAPKSVPVKATPVKAPTAAAAPPAHAPQPTPQRAQVPLSQPPRVQTSVPQRAMPAQGGKPAERLTAAVPAVSKDAAAAAADAASKKPVTSRHGFKTNELIVYPAHGVGRIIGIEEQEIAGISLELFVIEFEKDKMTLRVPTSKLTSVGMRKLAEEGVLKKAMETLKGKARIKRTMWSRRAQEYEAKINSGDLIAIAEVVRDLYRSEAQPEQSYSERQLYEAALDRMSRELAAVDRSDERSAMQRITEVLSKSARGRRATEEQQSDTTAADGEVKAA